MRKQISSATLLLGIFAGLLLFIPVVILMDRNEMFEVLNLLACALSAGLVVSIHPAAWRAVKLPIRDLTAGKLLAVAVTVLGFALIGVFAGQYWWRYMDKASSISDSVALAFSRWLVVVGLVLAFIASGAERGEVPVSSYQKAGGIIAGTILIAGLLLTFGFG